VLFRKLLQIVHCVCRLRRDLTVKQLSDQRKMTEIRPRKPVDFFRNFHIAKTVVATATALHNSNKIEAAGGPERPQKGLSGHLWHKIRL